MSELHRSINMAFRTEAPRDGSQSYSFEGDSPLLRTIIDSGTNIHVASLSVMEQLRKLDALSILHSASPTQDLGFVRFGKKEATAPASSLSSKEPVFWTRWP